MSSVPHFFLPLRLTCGRDLLAAVKLLEAGVAAKEAVHLAAALPCDTGGGDARGCCGSR